MKERFMAATGSDIFLELGQTEVLESYLRSKAWIGIDEQVLRTERPGEGNMNFVLRVITDQSSFIVKQSRPWVEKYPQLDAPVERIYTEAQFYTLVQKDEVLRPFTPQLLATDPDNYIIQVEDLGNGADFSHVYQKGKDFSSTDLESLLRFLEHLHHGEFTKAKKNYPKNQALKALNHEHIFSFPYRADNGLDLDAIQAGLHQLATPIYADGSLRAKIVALGENYLGEGPHLIHGDYYPGSWLNVGGGVKVIDPEFSYFGWAEFDLGVFLAHMKMAQSTPSSVQWVHRQYRRPPGFSESLLNQFIGVEILRRLIGIAQLPLSLTVEEKGALISEAVELIESV